MHIDGACHCGNITYTADIDPAKAVICHCTDCQTLSGSVYRTVVPVPEADYNLLTGTPKIYVKTAESGNLREQAFCPDCGTPLYASSVGGEARVLGLRVGAIKQRGDIVPQKQIFGKSALGWLPDMPDIPTA